jgi:hypothetical protein
MVDVCLVLRVDQVEIWVDLVRNVPQTGLARSPAVADDLLQVDLCNNNKQMQQVSSQKRPNNTETPTSNLHSGAAGTLRSFLRGHPSTTTYSTAH